MLRKAGLDIPNYIGQDGQKRPVRHTNEFWDTFGVSVHEGLYIGGDLIFFSRNGIFPTHIGIVQDEGSYIHAPGSDNTKVEIKAIRQAKIIGKGVSRLLYARNPIGFKSPTVAIDRPSYRYHQKPI